MTRRARLVECKPEWMHGRYRSDPPGPFAGIRFECPEGHARCWHAIPFTPALDGTPRSSWQQNGAIWQRTGDTFDTLTLEPSIRREPVYATRETALAAGALPQYLEDTHFCAFHARIISGAIIFCDDSR